MKNYNLAAIEVTLNEVAKEKGLNWRVTLHRHAMADLVDVGFCYKDFEDIRLFKKTVREEELRSAPWF